MSLAQNVSDHVPQELPRAINVARSLSPDVTQVFYLDGKDMQQSQYQNNRWSQGSVGSSFPSPDVSNAPLGAVGDNSTTVNMYFVVNGAIHEVSSSTTSDQWSVNDYTVGDYN